MFTEFDIKRIAAYCDEVLLFSMTIDESLISQACMELDICIEHDITYSEMQDIETIIKQNLPF